MNDPKQTIDQVVKDLADKQVILNGQGYCFAMAEIVQTMLKKAGIDS